MIEKQRREDQNANHVYRIRPIGDSSQSKSCIPEACFAVSRSATSGRQKRSTLSFLPSSMGFSLTVERVRCRLVLHDHVVALRAKLI